MVFASCTEITAVNQMTVYPIIQKGIYALRKIRRFLCILLCLCLLGSTAAGLLPRAQATSEMTASESCVEFIKSVEGFSPHPYYDYSQHTVGYGTKCPTDKYFEYAANGIPRDEAETLLRETLVEIADAIHQKLMEPYGLEFSQHQFDALVSFSFNIGTAWMTYDSTLRNAILTGAGENDLVYAFSLYCTAGGKYLSGLAARRLCEANMYLNGAYSLGISSDMGYVYYDANGGSVTYRVQGYLCDNMVAPAVDAVRIGDVFLGWYTDLTGGTRVNTLTGDLTGKTLFARWQSSENPENQNSPSMTVRVTGDVVNIRNGPGTNYGIASQVRMNDILVVSHVTHLTNMKWGKVQDGWICLDYTNYDAVLNGTGTSVPETDNTHSDWDTGPEVTLPAEPDEDPDAVPETTGGLSGTVNVNNTLRIRSGPGTTYSEVGYLRRGQTVEILEQKTSGATVWGRIEKGWVCMDYIITETAAPEEPGDTDTDQETVQKPQSQPEQEITDSVIRTESTAIDGRITADALRIRSGPGAVNSIVGFYYTNDRVFIGEKALVGSVYWGKTNRGWISMDYVSTDLSGEEPARPAEGDTKTVIADCLRIRKDAGTGHKIVGFLYEGDSTVVFDTKTVDGNVWGRVEKGWICMDYVK